MIDNYCGPRSISRLVYSFYTPGNDESGIEVEAIEESSNRLAE